MPSPRRPRRNMKSTTLPFPPAVNSAGGNKSLHPKKSAEPGTMTPVGFLRKICMMFHKPELAYREGAVLFSDQAQMCFLDHWHPSGMPCLKPHQESAGIDIGPLPLAVIRPDGSPGTAIAVSKAAAEKLVEVVSVISRFKES